MSSLFQLDVRKRGSSLVSEHHSWVFFRMAIPSTKARELQQQEAVEIALQFGEDDLDDVGEVSSGQGERPADPVPVQTPSPVPVLPEAKVDQLLQVVSDLAARMERMERADQMEHPAGGADKYGSQAFGGGSFRSGVGAIVGEQEEIRRSPFSKQPHFDDGSSSDEGKN